VTGSWSAAFFGFVATVLVNALGIFLFVKVVDLSGLADLSLSWRCSGLLALIYITLR
jgi:ABC-type amino acid transport system permease subunit